MNPHPEMVRDHICLLGRVALARASLVQAWRDAGKVGLARVWEAGTGAMAQEAMELARRHLAPPEP